MGSQRQNATGTLRTDFCYLPPEWAEDRVPGPSSRPGPGTPWTTADGGSQPYRFHCTVEPKPLAEVHWALATLTVAGISKVTVPVTVCPFDTWIAPSSKFVYPASESKSAEYFCPPAARAKASLFASSACRVPLQALDGEFQPDEPLAARWRGELVDAVGRVDDLHQRDLVAVTGGVLDLEIRSGYPGALAACVDVGVTATLPDDASEELLSLLKTALSPEPTMMRAMMPKIAPRTRRTPKRRRGAPDP